MESLRRARASLRGAGARSLTWVMDVMAFFSIPHMIRLRAGTSLNLPTGNRHQRVGAGVDCMRTRVRVSAEVWSR